MATCRSRALARGGCSRVAVYSSLPDGKGGVAAPLGPASLGVQPRLARAGQCGNAGGRRQGGAGGLDDLCCEFDEASEPAAKARLDERVIVTGVLRTSRKTGRQQMEAETIEPDFSGRGDVAAPFWAS